MPQITVSMSATDTDGLFCRCYVTNCGVFNSSTAKHPEEYKPETLCHANKLKTKHFYAVFFPLTRAIADIFH